DIKFFPITCMVGEYKVFVFAIGHSSCAKWKYAEDSIIQKLISKSRIPTCKPDEWTNKSIIKPVFDYHVKHRTLANINWHQFFITWTNTNSTIIELRSALESIYPRKYEF
ncbi:7164_t:CDS:2, partial [Cetraspora pellucida]